MVAEWPPAEFVAVLAVGVATEAPRLEQAFVAEVSLQAEVPVALVEAVAEVALQLALVAEAEAWPQVAVAAVWDGRVPMQGLAR